MELSPSYARHLISRQTRTLLIGEAHHIGPMNRCSLPAMSITPASFIVTAILLEKLEIARCVGGPVEPDRLLKGFKKINARPSA